jgi:hypothetical protein
MIILDGQLGILVIKTFKTTNGTNMAPFGSRPASPSGRQALLR